MKAREIMSNLLGFYTSDLGSDILSCLSLICFSKTLYLQDVCGNCGELAPP